MDLFNVKRFTLVMVGCGVCAVMCGCPKKNTYKGYEGYEDDLGRLNPIEIPMPDRLNFDDMTLDTSAEFENVRFRYDNYQVDSEEVYKVEEVARYMQGEPSTYLITEGHCDERGSREYNLSLGEHRSQAVRAYLISLGIAPDRIQTRSLGEEQPLDPGHGEDAWLNNRRAEFSIYR